MAEMPRFKRTESLDDVEKTAANNLAVMKKQAELLVEDYEIYCSCDNDRLRGQHCRGHDGQNRPHYTGIPRYYGFYRNR